MFKADASRLGIVAAHESQRHALGEFLAFMEEHFGLRASALHGAATLVQTLESRVRMRGMSSLDVYVARLHAGELGADEVAFWAHELTVNETYFFRNERDWNALKHHILPGYLHRYHHALQAGASAPDHAGTMAKSSTDSPLESVRHAIDPKATHTHRQTASPLHSFESGAATESARRSGLMPLRVLSLGCATGEEPWSMAMMLVHHFPQLIDEREPIQAGDIDGVQLEVAAAGGPYSARSIRLVDQGMRERFLSGGGNRWMIKEEWKNLVRFQSLNLLKLGAVRTRRFDLIFCRNVLIYFEPEATRTVLQSLVRMLAPGGHLILGHSEGWLVESARLPLRIIEGCLCVSQEAHAAAARHALVEATSAPSCMAGHHASRSLAAESAGVSNAPLPQARVSRNEEPAPGGGGIQVGASPQHALGMQHGEFHGHVRWRSVHELMAHARTLAHRGRVDEARRQLRLVLLRDALADEARYLLGMLELCAGEMEAAARTFEQILEHAADHLMARLQLTVLLTRMGRHDEAAHHCMQLARLIATRDEDEVVDAEQGITIGFLNVVCASMTATVSTRVQAH